jgi:hypothetical protein
MAIASDTIDHATLAHLVEAGVVHGAEVIGQSGGWGVVIKYGMTERALAARRGTIRNFKKFETLVSYLKALGIAEYRVNAVNFDPVALKERSTRPDATARLKNAHQAAAYNKWFLEQVDEGIREADDPNTVMVPHSVVKKEFAAKRLELEQRIKAAGK